MCRGGKKFARALCATHRLRATGAEEKDEGLTWLQVLQRWKIQIEAGRPASSPGAQQRGQPGPTSMPKETELTLCPSKGNQQLCGAELVGSSSV